MNICTDGWTDRQMSIGTYRWTDRQMNIVVYRWMAERQMNIVVYRWMAERQMNIGTYIWMDRTLDRQRCVKIKRWIMLWMMTGLKGGHAVFFIKFARDETFMYR
jgi:hypothetical protein